MAYLGATYFVFPNTGYIFVTSFYTIILWYEIQGINTHDRVPDLEQAVAFYTGILGFTCTEYSEDWQWASISRDETGLMLAKPNEHTPYNGPMYTGSFYIRVDDVDTLWNELKDKVEIVYAIDNFDYGMRDFAIKDNNGFMLQFGQEIEN